MTGVQAKVEVVSGGNALETDWMVYNFICSHAHCTIYEISKHLNCSISKVIQSVRRLVDANMVRMEEEVVGGGITEVIVPVKWTEYFTEDELKEIKAMKASSTSDSVHTHRG